MNTIKKLRLFLFTIMSMVGMNVFGQNIILSTKELEVNADEQNKTFVVKSDVDWNVTIEYPDGQPLGWLSISENGIGIASSERVTVTLHCTKNNSTTEREAIVKVSGEGVTEILKFTQWGQDTYLNVNTTSLFFNPTGSTQKIAVTSTRRALSFSLVSSMNFPLTGTSMTGSVNRLAGG